MACVDEKQIAQQFAEFYCNLIDKNRTCIASYLAEDVVLDWFGRTVNGRDAVANFVNLQLPEMVHEFTSVEPTGPIQHRKKCFGPAVNDGVMMTETYSMQGVEEELATPFGHQEVGQGDSDATVRFQNLKINDEIEDSADCSNGGRESWEYKFTTPVSKEIGTGDLMKSTNLGGGDGGEGDGFMTLASNTIATCASGNIEARGCIQFQRTRQSRVAPKNMKLVCDTMRWERSCKLKIAYSTEAIPNNEYTDVIRGFKIWLIVYQDNTKCRRNLIGAFEQQ